MIVRADSVAERFSSWLHGEWKEGLTRHQHLNHIQMFVCTCRASKYYHVLDHINAIATHLIFFSLPVGMHVKSHRSEELCTVVQKLSFSRQTLKLYLIVVPHLIQSDGETG